MQYPLGSDQHHHTSNECENAHNIRVPMDMGTTAAVTASPAVAGYNVYSTYGYMYLCTYVCNSYSVLSV